MQFKAMTVAALMAAASYASAIGTTWTYQSVLFDNGSPANGVYDVQIQLYDAAVGGTLLSTQVFNNEPVTRGTWTGNVDFGSNFNDGKARWVAIGIRPGPSGGAYTVLTPRQPVLPTPHAIRSQSTQFLQQYNEAPNDSNFAVRSYNYSGSSGGGALYTYTETGTTTIIMEPDFDGEGGYFNVDGGTGSFSVNGAFGGPTAGPFVSMSGPSSSCNFDTNATGTSSVSLPTGAISSGECDNEPGVASATNSGSTSLASGVTVLDSRTISCPTSGYVLVIGSAEVAINHTTGGGSSGCNLGVSDSSTSYPLNEDVDTWLPSGAASGTYYFGTTAHGLFSVTSGAHTFYLLGNHETSNGSSSCADRQLTCLFIPTSYGTVTPTLLAPGNTGDRETPAIGAMTENDIVNERQQSVLDNQARVDAELKAMREEIATLRQQLAQDKNAAAKQVD
ncbi:MAG: hypothetical protein R3B49_06350 [Phycisphaerales bacterium]